MACDLVSEILGNECIGDSRGKINDNFSALETAVCTLSTNTISVVDTTTIDLDYTSSSRIISGAVRTNSINDTHIQNNSITTNKIAPDTVRYSQLASWQSLSATPLSAEAVQPRVAKAWVSFNGDPASPTIYKSFNVSSITKTSAGAYQINFTTSMQTSSFAVVGMSQDLSNGNPSSNGFLIMLEGISLPAKANNFVKIRTWNASTGAFQSATDISVLVFD